MATATRGVTEEMRISLSERVSAMHRLWDQLTRDLTLEHVNHLERSGVLPIAFTLAHAVPNEDHSVASLFSVELLWDAHVGRIRLTTERPKRFTPMDVAEKVRIGDLAAFREYQRAVFERTERVIAEASLEQLATPHPIPQGAFAGGFLALLVGTPDRIRVIDALEAWVFQHGIRHVGELEHARALVGLRGVT